MTKEQAYDEKINPLMAQILAICKEHKIAMLASFTLDYDSGLQCTSTLLEDDYDPTDALIEAERALFPNHRSPLMITTRNDKGEVTSMEAIP